MKQLLIALMVLLLPLSAMGEVKVVGPPKPVNPGVYTMIQVMGLSDQELPLASVEVNPSEDVTLLPAKTWGGSPIIIFSASTPAKYTVSVTINGWVKQLDLAVAGVPAINATTLSQLHSVVDSIDKSYPTSSSSCVVEVAGNVPPPPVPTPTPVPVPSGKRVAMVIYETGDSSQELDSLITTLRTGSTAASLSQKGHKIQFLDKDLLDENKQPSKLVQQVMEAAKSKNNGVIPTMPFVVFFDPSQPVGSSVLEVASFPVPVSYKAADVTAALNKFMDLLKKAGG